MRKSINRAKYYSVISITLTGVLQCIYWFNIYNIPLWCTFTPLYIFPAFFIMVIIYMLIVDFIYHRRNKRHTKTELSERLNTVMSNYYRQKDSEKR